MTETFRPTAKIICDSINEQGHRLTTMEVVMHRFILAEFNTHRVFSRNSSSSRAIPYHKMRNRVVENPAYPIFWGSEQKGMSPGGELEGVMLTNSKNSWLSARDCAVFCADLLHEYGLHKSLINRLIEPFMRHTAIVTATEWDNFFHQRCHPAAMPEIQALANAMQIAYFSSVPKEVGYGNWHLPYIKQGDREWVRRRIKSVTRYEDEITALKQISTARCARVSYLTHDGKRDPNVDMDLFDKLQSLGHWSPFEHVATPINTKVPLQYDGDGPCGNFKGWNQFRKEFRNENQTHFLPNLPELAQIRMKLEAGRKL